MNGSIFKGIGFESFMNKAGLGSLVPALPTANIEPMRQ